MLNKSGRIKLGTPIWEIEQQPKTYTGEVWCTFMDSKGEYKRELFLKEFLEPIDDNTMPFPVFEKEIVSLLKVNGEVIDNIKAAVSQKNSKIFITRSDILIEPNDLIHRVMSNGGEETYQVIDPGYHEAFSGIQAGYGMKVRKLGHIEAEREKTIINNNYTYNFGGNNNRVNNNSVDSSTNIIHKNAGNINGHLETLRYEIEKLKISAVDKQDLVDLLEALEDQIHSDKPKLSVIKTIIGTLSTHGAEIASIGSFILQLVQPTSA